MIAATVAWDDDASRTWESATEELQKTMSQVCQALPHPNVCCVCMQCVMIIDQTNYADVFCYM